VSVDVTAAVTGIRGVMPAARKSTRCQPPQKEWHRHMPPLDRHSPVDTSANSDALSRLDAGESPYQPFVERRRYLVVGASAFVAVDRLAPTIVQWDA
jgi:hypothetical protein